MSSAQDIDVAFIVLLGLVLFANYAVAETLIGIGNRMRGSDLVAEAHPLEPGAESCDPLAAWRHASLRGMSHRWQANQ